MSIRAWKYIAQNGIFLHPLGSFAGFTRLKTRDMLTLLAYHVKREGEMLDL